MTTRVCVADATTVFRAAVRQVLAREPDFEVSEASDLPTLERAVERGVDIALIDDALPPSGALGAVEICAGRCDEIVVWSFRPERTDVLAAIRAGATGYLRKEIAPSGLVRSLRGAAQGESPLARDLATLIVEALHESEDTQRQRELSAVLSAREREVLGHVALGSRNNQIAAIPQGSGGLLRLDDGAPGGRRGVPLSGTAVQSRTAATYSCRVPRAAMLGGWQ